MLQFPDPLARFPASVRLIHEHVSGRRSLRGTRSGGKQSPRIGRDIWQRERNLALLRSAWPAPALSPKHRTRIKPPGPRRFLNEGEVFSPLGSNRKRRSGTESG